MIYAMILGYFLDLFGRRKTIITSFAVMTICLAITPYMGSVYPGLAIVRVIFGLCNCSAFANPQVNDLVKSEYRGRAIAFSGYGFVLGEVFSYAVLVNITKNVSYEIGFGIASGILAVLTAVFYFLIKEPHEVKSIAASSNLEERLLQKPDQIEIVSESHVEE